MDFQLKIRHSVSGHTESRIAPYLAFCSLFLRNVVVLSISNKLESMAPIQSGGGRFWSVF